MEIGAIRKEEYETALSVARESFLALDAHYFVQEGVDSFLNYAAYDAFCYRQQHNHETYVARHDGIVVGMLELRRRRHICMLFVRPDQTRKGIGRALIERAFARCARKVGPQPKITVHASPYAVEFYRKMGFYAEDDFVTEQGLRYLPMATKKA